MRPNPLYLLNPLFKRFHTQLVHTEFVKAQQVQLTKHCLLEIQLKEYIKENIPTIDVKNLLAFLTDDPRKKGQLWTASVVSCQDLLGAPVEKARFKKRRMRP
jgi:hypothetical protein